MVAQEKQYERCIAHFLIIELIGDNNQRMNGFLLLNSTFFGPRHFVRRRGKDYRIAVSRSSSSTID